MLIDAFITYLRCELNLSAHTVLSYSIDLRQWADYATNGKIEELHPEDVTVNDLRLWVTHLSKQGIKPRSIRRKMSALRTFYTYLMRRHGYTANPAAEITPARGEKRLPSFIPQKEIENVLNSNFDETDFESMRNRLIIDMLYSTGMRASELTGLSDSNVDTAKGELKVLGKRNKERIIPFGKELSTMIDAYRTLRKTTLAEHTHPVAFFVKADGFPLTYHNLYKIVHEELDGRVHAGTISPHVLRHTFATDMLNNGAELNAVQHLLGHQSLATTQIYTHITVSEIKSNYELAHPRALKKGGHHGSKNPSNPL